MLLISQDGKDMFETGAGTHVWQSGNCIYIENVPGAQAFRLGRYDSEKSAEEEFDRLRRSWDRDAEVRVG